MTIQGVEHQKSLVHGDFSRGFLGFVALYPSEASQVLEGETMFDQRFTKYPSGRDGRDKHLSALLREWQGIEPEPCFEASVWQRIRQDAARAASREPDLPRPGVSWLEWLLPGRVWATAMTLLLFISAGSLLGMLAGRSTPHHEDSPLLQPQTLAGSFLAMNTGGAR